MPVAETDKDKKDKRDVPHLRLSPKTSVVFLIGTLLRYNGMSFGPSEFQPRGDYSHARNSRWPAPGEAHSWLTKRIAHASEQSPMGVEIKRNMGSADSRTGSF